MGGKGASTASGDVGRERRVGGGGGISAPCDPAVMLCLRGGSGGSSLCELCRDMRSGGGGGLLCEACQNKKFDGLKVQLTKRRVEQRKIKTKINKLLGRVLAAVAGRRGTCPVTPKPDLG